MIDPVQEALAAGIRTSSWHRLGGGPWSGTVYLPGEGTGSAELAVEELASSWKVTDETGKTSSGKELGPLLKKALAARTSTKTVKTAAPTTRKKQVKRP